MDASSNCYDAKKDKSKSHAYIRNQAESIRTALLKPGVYSTNHMKAAGFEYTGNGDIARCKDCGLEVSNWTLDMKPFEIHLKWKPDCPFVRSMMTSASVYLPSIDSSSTTATGNESLVNEQENPSNRSKIEIADLKHSSNTFLESDSLQQVRRRTFSHWPHRTIPSSAQMIEAGFFSCNIGDRVICIHCNLICHQWTSHTDDPCEVHRTLSPNCWFVKTKLTKTPPLPIINSVTSTNHNSFRSNEIVFTAACNPDYAELSKRHASFVTLPDEDLPSVDDLVRAGFFYTGKKTIVICFYCNGSLQNWGANDNPMIEHAKWFPHCVYAQQLCGAELYQKIQESKRTQRECVDISRSDSDNILNINIPTHSRQLLITDEDTLTSMVEARLDLPISQNLLDKNFKLSIIKKCWEDQLRLKGDDFVSDFDLYMACLILQRQIEHTDNKEENIMIPSRRMKQIKEHMHEQSSTAINETMSSMSNHQNQSSNWISSHPCILCSKEERQLACIPCGHLTVCLSCSPPLRSCPVCSEEIKSFVRVSI